LNNWKTVYDWWRVIESVVPRSRRQEQKTTRSQAVTRIAHCTALQQTILPLAIVAIEHVQPFSTYMDSKRFRSHDLTFQGHVTSSVTWPFNFPLAISYWRSFGTKPLSLTVSELFSGKCDAMVEMTLNDLYANHSFWYQSIPTGFQ